MQRTPKSLRLRLGVFGRTNVGKSALVNAITGQAVSIVDATPGTTTDPVDKAMELLPIGPVLFMDTAGLDDTGTLGAKRIETTRKVLERADVALLVTEPDTWGPAEAQWLEACRAQSVPVLVVVNKCDTQAPGLPFLERLTAQGHEPLCVSAATGQGIERFREALIRVLPPDALERTVVLGDLVPPGGLVVFVVPIDLEAPRGRLIMPQVQSLRDALDHDLVCVTCKERELRAALDRLTRPPDLVVTDSQAFLRVLGDCPDHVPVTSFSILFARLKGDLATYVEGAAAIDRLADGDRVLVAESCSHHPVGDDIGRVKIPRWLTQYTGCALRFDTVQGHDFTTRLTDYSLVIMCGGCTFNRAEIMGRIARCRRAGVPVTNYGITIAKTQGILARVLRPFPALADGEAAAAGEAATHDVQPTTGNL